MPEEKLYISSKLYLGVPMDEAYFLSVIKGQNITDLNGTRPGYKVTYPDGYISWSPKEAFETANREVTQAEKDLMLCPPVDADEVPKGIPPDGAKGQT